MGYGVGDGGAVARLWLVGQFRRRIQLQVFFLSEGEPADNSLAAPPTRILRLHSANSAPEVSNPSTTQTSEVTAPGQWFSDNIHPHDSSLKAYVRTSFPHLRDVDDVVQESYLRIWKARAAHPIQSGKAFLFTVARNVALNLMQRERISPVSAVANLTALPVLDDSVDVPETACTREEIALLADGIETLPPRCREVFILRRIQGVPQKEIAARLGISEQTVQVQVQRGVKQCAEFLRHRGVKRTAQHVTE